MKKVLLKSILTTLFLCTIFACQTNRPAQCSQSLNPKIFEELYKETKGIMIDVRTPEEFYTAQIPGAINMDLHKENFSDEVEKLDKNKFYFLYCFSGLQSMAAQGLMKRRGFKKVYVLNGGILEWRKAELPLLSEIILDKGHAGLSEADY